MRDEMQVGDLAFIYHSSCDVPGVAGIAEVVRAAHPDLSALDPKSEYFDEKSAKDGASRWLHVDVQAKQRLKAPVTLAAMRTIKGLEGMMLLKRGMRLSIQPVTPAEWAVIVKLGKPGPL
jgi:predicted RNA-binding protein with PUA-like domain